MILHVASGNTLISYVDILAITPRLGSRLGCGIDLAWGDKEKDGLCLIKAGRDSASIVSTCLTTGDEDLLVWLAKHAPSSDCVLLTIDAPLIVSNQSGCRPAEKAISSEYWESHACCHSSNAANPNCARPLRIAKLLKANGYTIDFDLRKSSRIAVEVYPHAGMVRLFGLERIIKYKKGNRNSIKAEFRKLQAHICEFLETVLHRVEVSPQINRLLGEVWTQDVEEQTDALFCAIVGYLHWRDQGLGSRVYGDLDSGFILLPCRYRNGFPLMEKRGNEIVTPEIIKQLIEEDL